MRMDEALKYFGGGVVVYASMAACSSENAERAAHHLLDAGRSFLDVAADAGVVVGSDVRAPTQQDAALNDVRSRDASVFDALVHPVDDARAQSGCGTCGGGALRVMTAEQDPAQWLNATGLLAPDLVLSSGMSVAFNTVANGPLAVSYAHLSGASLYTVAAGSACSPDPASAAAEGVVTVSSILDPTVASTHHTVLSSGDVTSGAFAMVAEGETLCVKAIAVNSATPRASYRIQGFRPYAD